jgi:hypothetical protein
LAHGNRGSEQETKDRPDSHGSFLARNLGFHEPIFILIQDIIVSLCQWLLFRVNGDEMLPGGFTMQDLRTICADWDIKDDVSSIDPEEKYVIEQ